MMQVSKSKFFVGSLIAAALFSGVAAHANLVTNGDFETGDFTGWTSSLDPFGNDGVDVLAPNTGSNAAYFGNPLTSTISQKLVTVVGATYDISFWLQNEIDAAPLFASANAFEFNWDDGAVEQAVSNASAFGYTKYEFLLTASSILTNLSFSFTQTPDLGTYWDFDTVDVHIPEPGSIALTGLAGALALIASRRRRVTALRSAPVVA